MSRQACETIEIGRHRVSLMNEDPEDANAPLVIVVNNNLEIVCFNLDEDFFEKRFIGLTVRHFETLAEYDLDLAAIDYQGNALEKCALKIPNRETGDREKASGLMIKKRIND